MYDLILYDTSNFRDFPMGGQLTSIRNFLKYITDSRKNFAKRILLVGITTDGEEMGRLIQIRIGDAEFDFLPVLLRDANLANVQKSLRVEYLKALLNAGKKIPCHKKSVHYIHTPEAYIAVKLIHPSAKTAVFSHGSFFNMVQGFRFFRENKLVSFCFEKFLIWLLKTANLLLVLDEETAEQYRKYNKNVFRVENSVVLPTEIPNRESCHDPIKLLFVGRLSRVKGIEGILEATERMQGKAELTIVGDGEQRESLEQMIGQKKLENVVLLAGGCAPAEVHRFYRECDILVMNSVVEGKPMTILEAMSYGMPVVTTPVGGIPEMVTAGQSAEFTDGTCNVILEKVLMIKESYVMYAANAADRSSCFSHDKVNVSIMDRLEQL